MTGALEAFIEIIMLWKSSSSQILTIVKICDELDFHNIIISMKASRAPVMMAAYRMIADRLDSEGYNYPLHLGVTEAGDGDYGRIKSTFNSSIITISSFGHSQM